MQTMTAAPPTTPPEDVPLYWFAALELALNVGDFRKAAEAKDQLSRLGVTVTHRRPTSTTPRRPRGKEVTR